MNVDSWDIEKNVYNEYPSNINGFRGMYEQLNFQRIFHFSEKININTMHEI